MATFIAIFIYLLYIAIAVFIIASVWTVYKKAGKPGWACLVPIYSELVLLEIVGKPWWWLLMFFIPGVNLVFAIWAYNMLSKSFGKSESFTVGLILLPIVFFPILAFSKDIKYQGPYGLNAAKN